jgi:hypothetical protein
MRSFEERRLARIDRRGCFATTGCRDISARAAGAIAIVARQAAAKTKIIAVLMIITAALLCF